MTADAEYWIVPAIRTPLVQWLSPAEQAELIQITAEWYIFFRDDIPRAQYEIELQSGASGDLAIMKRRT